MTSASQLLKNYYAPYDATVIKKLKKQGVIFLRYVNADEFACGGSGENSRRFPEKVFSAQGRFSALRKP